MKSVLLSLFLSFAACTAARSENVDYEILVYGNSSAAVTAAVQGARMGKKVVFISSDPCVGGLTASGLGATDINKYQAIGGLSREFYQRIHKYYTNPSAWFCQDKEEYFASITKRVFTGRSVKAGMQWVFEPGVARKTFDAMLSEAGVEVVCGKLLRSKKGVAVKKDRIRSIRLEDGRTFRAKVFIDASYEGDLMARAGVSCFVGRESNDRYGETMNGIRPNKGPKKSKGRIDPYVVKGDPKSGLLPFVEPKVPGVAGTGDRRIQAYCFRFTLTDNPDNRIPVAKPADYNPLWFEFIARILEAHPSWSLKNVLTVTPMPNRKTDINHADFVGASYEWPEAGYKRRDELKKMHRDYALGLVWFLGNDPRVPEQIREEMLRWGLPKDEFTDNGNFPYQVYVREARRMVSDYVMTEHDVTGTRAADDGVGLGTYWFDSHVVSRFADETGAMRDEGGFWGKQAVYPVSYRAIVPRRGECANLIVPVCLSASHAAYGSIRMEPVYMVLGQSAAVAAAMAADAGIAVQEVGYEALRRQLLDCGQVLDANKK